MQQRSRRRWPLGVLAAASLVAGLLTTAQANAATSISSNEGLALGAGQLSVGSVVTGQLSAVVNSSIQGTYPQATWSDTTGSGAGWQGSLAVSSAIYTGTWTPQGSATALGSSSAGGYTGTADGLLITVSVGSGGTGTSTPFTWTDNHGGSGSGSATNGTPASVESGITIDFASGTTYTSGTQYQVQAGAQSASALELLSSAGSIAAASGTASPVPTFVNDKTAVGAGGAGAYGTSVPFVSAAADQGMGSYLVAPGVNVVVDASSWAATYVSQVQYTIASGPGGGAAGSGSGGTLSTQSITTFSYTGSSQTYTVPSGVSLVQVTAYGAQGQNGGDGGGVTATVPVTAGQVLWIYDGQLPTSAATGGTVSGAPGGFGQGGSGAANGDSLAAGGGATSVFLTSSATQAPAAPTASNVGSLVMAAGGGGGSGGAGGNPGQSASGGAGGTQTAGGAGTASGGFGYGGSTQPPNGDFPGGGGGGGFYGGGAGIGTNSNYGGGGGGGASWARSSAQAVSYTTGSNPGNGSVLLQPVGADPPTNLTATYDSSTGAVALSWIASPTSTVTGYEILRGGNKLANVSASTTNYTDTTAPAGQTLTYTVAATTSGLSSATVSATVITSAYDNAVLADSPSVAWNLSEGTGIAHDYSGNQINGTYQGGTAQAPPYNAVVGGSTTLNGTGYISATAPAPVAGNYTIAGWVNVASLPTWAGADPAPFSSFGYYGESGFGIRGDGHLTEISDQISWNETSATIPLNTWEFVAMTMTSSGTFTIYVNGTAVASGSPGVDSNTIIAVGGNGGRYLNGTVANFAFFQSVLSASQINTLYTSS